MKTLVGWGRLKALMFLAVLAGFSSLSSAGQERDRLPVEVVVNGVEFVRIPAGWFYKTDGVAGEVADAAVDDRVSDDRIRIWLDDYYIGKYEARARDLVAFLNADQGETLVYEGIGKSCSVGQESNGRYMQFRPDDNLPATHLSWEQANAWARWMGFRLPAELEWEKAARGTDLRRFPWGNEYPDETYARFRTRSYCSVQPVDAYKKGRSPYGIYNMAGNVYEYVDDWVNHDFDKNLKNGVRNPIPAAEGTFFAEKTEQYERGPWKMLKGGRWGSTGNFLRINHRLSTRPDHIFRCNGTRFAIDAESVREHLRMGSAEITRL